MHKTISSAKPLTGTLRVPGDKSITHRAALFSLLAQGKTVIQNPLEAEDCLSSLACVEALGAGVQKKPDEWIIESPGLSQLKKPQKELDCGNSGTTMRVLSGICAGQNFESVLIGDASLSKRPMARIADPLTQMGAHISLRDNKFPPIKIKGNVNLKVIQWKSPIASAQVKTAVLCAGLQTKGTLVYEEPSKSRDHTERMLKAMGAHLTEKGTEIRMKMPSLLSPLTWNVPADISSAAFMIVAALFVKNSKIILQGVNLNPTRTGLLDVLTQSGAHIKIVNQQQFGGEPVGNIQVEHTPSLKAFSIDKTLSPRLIDEIPVLAVAATQCHGESTFQGVGELRHKETDRISAIVGHLKAMGAVVKEDTNGFSIQGPTQLKGATLPSFDDHRIAMAFAVAGLLASGSTTIENSEAARISFPTFWDVVSKFS